MVSSALVVGGTGPTGPAVVRGLQERGYEVAIFHSGRHEVGLGDAVRHVHGDPHFAETISSALGTETFDVVIAQYGRLRYLIDHFRGRTGHLIGIGGAWGGLAGADADAWGDLGRPPVINEEAQALELDPSGRSFAFRVAEARRALRTAHADGAFAGTYIAYPTMYGPRQPLSTEWSVVRRLLDGRLQLLLPDGGMKLESRVFALNAAQAPLAAVDRMDVAAGREYVVADEQVHTVRQRIEFVARHLGYDVELIDVPYAVARPMHAFYRGRREHRVCTSERIREELGYADRHPVEEALARTVDWLVENRPEPGGELERQLADAFDYDREEQLIAASRAWLDGAPDVDYPTLHQAHPYPHPRLVPPADAADEVKVNRSCAQS